MKKKSSKASKLYSNIKKNTLQFLSGQSYRPLKFSELKKKLDIPPQNIALFKEILANLIKDAVIELKNDRYLLCEDEQDIVKGLIKVHARGFGFLQIEGPNPFNQEIFVPKNFMQNAVDGDTVEVRVNTEVISDKGPEGEVIAILKRGRSHVAGIVSEIHWNDTVYAHVPLLGRGQKIHILPTEEIILKLGDRVVLEVVEWGARGGETVCRFSHYLGHISDPSCDIKAAVEEFQLSADFPHKAKEEAKAFGNRIPQKEIAKREDFRDVEIFTIDPDTAKDFDDALSLDRDKQGNYHLGVHIADASFYVRPGTELDQEAQKRCNSTYFPGCCLPMLPKELSESLCSLKPNVNRLTVSVLMTFNKKGNLKNYRITRSVIRSCKRFTYGEAKEVIDGKKKSVHSKTLGLMVDLCLLLKKKRVERGSLEFALPELVIKIDQKGNPTGTETVEYDVTHQMVEEFMLKANEVVAEHISKEGKALTYRIHEEPSEEKLKEFSSLVSIFGFNLSENPTPKELQVLFDEALKTPYGQFLATSYIKRMRMAYYSPENIGHYGLGLTYYCHFTSPIRRYVDTVAHRVLFGEQEAAEQISLISEKSSAQERVSSKAEHSVRQIKKLRLLKNYYKEDPKKQYEAVVSVVKQHGIVFEVLEIGIEGFLHISRLHNDYFIYDESSGQLNGQDTKVSFKAGDQISVMLKEIDFIQSDATWHLITESFSPKKRDKKESSPKIKKSKNRKKQVPLKKKPSFSKGKKKSTKRKKR